MVLIAYFFLFVVDARNPTTPNVDDRALQGFSIRFANGKGLFMAGLGN
jgi:hypothetical protein